MTEISVTATENAVMAAVLAKGKTNIHLAAAEPHVQDLCKFLKKLGAKIKGIGTHDLEITGVNKLKGGEFTVTGDYLEAGTFAIVAAVTNGKVTIQGINPRHLDSFWQKLEEAGVKFTFTSNSVTIHPHQKLNNVAKIRTAVFPSFPTDLQAPFAVLLTQTPGDSMVHETLFDGRLNYLAELEKMGAKFEILNPHQAIIKGKTSLNGVPISSWDIRAGAAMVLAALVAKGTTEISNIEYIDRGYEKLEQKLTKLGAKIERK
jgi:UDP-N-acetylglucosamine 1-carboxyvinyltransferase